MILQAFISETLKEIIAGVKEAQEYAASQNAKVNPSARHIGGAKSPVLVDDSTLEHLQNVEFDVAVTSTEGSTTEAGAGIFVAAIGMGAKGKSDTSSSSISRIKFSVPLGLPTQYKTKLE